MLVSVLRGIPQIEGPQTSPDFGGRKELLRADQFDRVISALIAGQLLDDAKRMHEQMLAQGFKLSEATSTALRAVQSRASKQC